MFNYTFFYCTGWAFELTGAGLVALMVGESMTEGTVPFFRRTASWLVFLFLIAASIHACAWLLEAAGVMHAGSAYVHYKSLSGRVGYLLELGAVFAPLLLWIPGLRVLPAAVLGIAALAVAPWVISLFGSYFGIHF